VSAAVLSPAVATALEHSASGRSLGRDDGLVLIGADASELPAILEAAAALRDRGKGRTITYSRKVFLPLTNLCRDDCSYCTFKRDPGQPGARTMELDEVLAVCETGARLGCKKGDSRSATSPRRAAPSIATG
jgi:FO synthase